MFEKHRLIHNFKVLKKEYDFCVKLNSKITRMKFKVFANLARGKTTLKNKKVISNTDLVLLIDDQRNLIEHVQDISFKTLKLGKKLRTKLHLSEEYRIIKMQNILIENIGDILKSLRLQKESLNSKKDQSEIIKEVRQLIKEEIVIYKSINKLLIIEKKDVTVVKNQIQEMLKDTSSKIKWKERLKLCSEFGILLYGSFLIANFFTSSVSQLVKPVMKKLSSLNLQDVLVAKDQKEAMIHSLKDLTNTINILEKNNVLKGDMLEHLGSAEVGLKYGAKTIQEYHDHIIRLNKSVDNLIGEGILYFIFGLLAIGAAVGGIWGLSKLKHAWDISRKEKRILKQVSLYYD